MRKNAKRVSAMRTQAIPRKAQVGPSTSNPKQTEVTPATGEKPDSSEPETSYGWLVSWLVGTDVKILI